MKCTISYTNQFFISEELPFSRCNVWLEDGTQVPGELGSGEDEVKEVDGKLRLMTPCGLTVFKKYIRVPGGFLVLGKLNNEDGWVNAHQPYIVEARFYGAYNSLNAAKGVNFPYAHLDNIESSLGSFKTAPFNTAEEQYQLARVHAGLATYEDYRLKRTLNG